MHLTDLLAAAAIGSKELDPRALDPELGQLDIQGLTADSREVRPGFLFAALPGSRQDGRDFIDQAIQAGASAVLAPSGTILLKSYERPLALLTDGNPRRALALLAAAFYGRQPNTLVCVTGTSGKTSVVHFTRSLWTLLGKRAASLGTLGLVPADAVPDPVPYLTTPDPVALMRTLSGLARAGYEQVAMEASSHGLDQFRLDGVRPRAAAFTNLSHDHLDYHGTLEAYFAAKCRLFAELLPEGAPAVVDLDVPEAAKLSLLAKQRGLRFISYGGAEGADLRILERRPTPAGQDLVLSLFGRRQVLSLPLIGEFQARNVLAALGLVVGCGEPLEAVLPHLPRLTGVPGRLEYVATTPAGGRVYVDYAHKPGALQAVLETIRPHTPGRLWVIFGCGGDRDQKKRPVMGEIAARLADQAIVTDDNPRGEDPAAIRRAVMAACPQALEIGDRQAAIATGLMGVGEGDVLIIAGKGHESGQTVGDKVLPFDDREVARRLTAELEAAA